MKSIFKKTFLVLVASLIALSTVIPWPLSRQIDRLVGQPRHAYAASQWGYTTIGSSNNTINANQMIGNNWTAPADITTLSSISVYTFRATGANAVIKAFLVDNITQAIVATTENTTVTGGNAPATYTLSFAVPPAVTPGAMYWQMVMSTATISYYYDSDTAHPRWIDSTNNFGTPTNPNDMTTTQPYKLTLYGNYDVLAAPTLSSMVSSNVLATSATIAGNVTATGGDNPSVILFWGASDGGTTPASWSFNGTPDSPAQPQGVVQFTKSISSLSASTLYYYSARGVNSGGTGWATTANFTTVSLSAPVVTTPLWSEIKTTNATGAIRVQAINGDNVTNTAIQYGTVSSNYTSNVTLAVASNGTGRYYIPITGLSGNTTYYYRAGAYNGEWGWGSEQSSKTMPISYEWSSPTLIYSDAAAPATNQGGGWSPDGTLYVHAGSSNPYFTYYKLDVSGANFTKLGDPSTITPDAETLSWNAGSTRIYETWNSGGGAVPIDPDAYVYSWNGTDVVLVNSISSNITMVNAIALSPDGELLAMGGDNDTYRMSIQLVTGDNFTELVGFTQPSGDVKGLAWRNSRQLAVSVANGQTIELYNVSDNGTALSVTKASNPPSGGGNGYNPSYTKTGDKEFLAAAINVPSQVVWWEIINDVYYLLTSPAATDGAGQSVRWSPDSNFLVLSSRTSANISFTYQRTANTSLTLTPDFPPTGTGASWAEWNPSQRFLAIGSTLRMYQTGNITSTTSPTLTAQAVTNITQTSAVANGTITATGGEDATEVFAQFSNISDATSDFANNCDNVTVSGSYEAGAFSVNLTNLFPGVTYYLRVGATNPAGNGYSTEVSFTTSDNISVPTVTTANTTDIGTTTANITGTLTSSLITKAFGNPVANLAGMLVATTNPGRVAALTYNSHTASENETIIQYAFPSRSTANDVNIGLTAYVLDGVGENATDRLAAPTYIHVPISSYTWFYSEIVNQPLTVGVKYGVASGNFSGANPVYYKGMPNMGIFTVWAGIEGVGLTDPFPTVDHYGNTLPAMAALYTSTTNLTAWGIDWGLAPGVYTNSVNVSGSLGLSDFTVQLTGLPAGNIIYARAKGTNGGGEGYGNEMSFTTDNATIPDAPTGVSATDGTSTSNVTVSWNAVVGATDYRIWRDSTDLGLIGNVLTYADVGANAPTITGGTASASDGTSNTTITLSVAGEGTTVGTTHTYKVQAYDGVNYSANSTSNSGYRGVGVLIHQWHKSLLDDALSSYSALIGGTTDPYLYVGGNFTPSGNYYLDTLSAEGAVSTNSTSNRGYLDQPATPVTPTSTEGVWILVGILPYIFALLGIVFVLVLAYSGEVLAAVVVGVIVIVITLVGVGLITLLIP